MGIFDPPRKKIIDLSLRQPVPVRPLPLHLFTASEDIPRFSNQNHAIGATAGLVSDLFVPNCTCIVQRVICQLTTANTIQLLVNGEPVSAVMSFAVNTVVEFPGFILPNNAKVSLIVTSNSPVNFDVVWIKEFCLDHILKQLFVTSPGLTDAQLHGDFPLPISQVEGTTGATGQVIVPATVGGIQIRPANPNRQAVLIVNMGTTDVFLGYTNAVTIANGMLLPGIKGAAITIPNTQSIYGIVAAGTQVVSYISSDN